MNARTRFAFAAPRTLQMTDVRTEVLPDFAALHEHRAQWWALWRRVPDATPFQSPAWLLCWARHYAPDRSGAVAVADGDTLLALLPYFFWDDALWLAGTGPSDYGDALVAPGAACMADALLATLAGIALRRGCARIDLRQLRPASTLLAAAAPPGWRSETAPGATCMSLRLRGDDGLGAMSGRWRRNIAYAWRKLECAGACTLERVPPDRTQGGMDALLQMHERRWNARGSPGSFADELPRAFVHSVIPALGDAGLLRMYALVCDGCPLAGTFAMHAPGTTHLYTTGFDPGWSRYSPGLLSIIATIRGAAAEGDHTMHLLRGRERYKYHLGAVECMTWRRVLRRDV